MSEKPIKLEMFEIKKRKERKKSLVYPTTGGISIIPERHPST